MRNKILNSIKSGWRKFRTNVSSAFIVSLFLSFIFWYSGKLQYTYTAEIPITVIIDGESHTVSCVVEATGHNIISARFLDRHKVKLNSSDLTIIPMEGSATKRKVTPESLQNAISLRYSDLKVSAVSTAIILD